MKITKSIAMFAMAAMLFVSCKEIAKEPDAANSNETTTEAEASNETAANLETTSFEIEGMTCAIGCAKVIENKLAKMDGVSEAKVDFDSKTATIQYDAAQQSPEKIVETVEGIAEGAYKVANVKNSADKAELFKADQEPEKKKDKKKCDKEGKSCCSTTKAEKKGCCSKDAKKSCDKKKA
ncbi:hypothetical protein GCM10007424_26870 [Flavobacterium suaedae]|uniref:HMA domain-containing protein n=1 Tax=Flavobacterium suaedae TaxID=1767027 RepID=A0ABQ1K5T6_9FLAO|nr:heavy-metal-associated domain-containing protein [Flavobacterium suaedae]GGB85444.1 hypothetical protein GCM10007424_26870 [Flavobacterium suaedae]